MSAVHARILDALRERTNPVTGLARVSDLELIDAAQASRRWTQRCFAQLREQGRIEVTGYEGTERRRVVRVVR